MGKQDRSSSASRSYSSITQQNHNIPDLFRSQSRDMKATALFSSDTLHPGSNGSPPPSHPPPETNPQVMAAPSLDDLKAVVSDIKNTLSAAISDLRRDIQAIAMRMDEVEGTTARHDLAIQGGKTAHRYSHPILP